MVNKPSLKFMERQFTANQAVGTVSQQLHEVAATRPHVARHGAMTLGTSVVIQALNAFTGIVLARSLGPAGRGQLAAVVLWPLVVVAIGQLGCFEAVAYYTAKAPSNSEHIAATALLLAGAQSILVIAIAYPLVPFILGH